MTKYKINNKGKNIIVKQIRKRNKRLKFIDILMVDYVKILFVIGVIVFMIYK